LFAVQGGINLGVAGCQSGTALFQELMNVSTFFSDESEAFENSAITKAVGIRDQLQIVAVVSFEICVQAIDNVLDSAAKQWIIKHIDNRAMKI
jgi:hypothetical protein